MVVRDRVVFNRPRQRNFIVSDTRNRVCWTKVPWTEFIEISFDGQHGVVTISREREYKWKFNLYSIKLSDLSRESRSMLKLYNCWITRHQWINFNVLAAIIFHSTTAFKSSGNGYASFCKLLGIGSNLHTLFKRINPIRVVITLEFESNRWLGKFEKPKWTRSHTYLFQVNATIRWNSETRGRRRKCERIKYFT